MLRIGCNKCDRLIECLHEEVLLRATDEADDHERYIIGLGGTCKKLDEIIDKFNAVGLPNVMTYEEFCASFPDMEEVNDD